MKVKELIEKLSKEDPEKRVLVRGYETGYDEIKKIIDLPVKENEYKDWWDGEFEYSSDQQAESVLLLSKGDTRINK